MIQNTDLRYPLKIERDNSVVSLSRVLAEIRAAHQTNTISIKHLNDFKEHYTRVLNFSIADSRIKDLKYKKSSLVSIAGKVRMTKTTIENIEYQVRIAEIYIEALFSSGVLNI